MSTMSLNAAAPKVHAGRSNCLCNIINPYRYIPTSLEVLIITRSQVEGNIFGSENSTLLKT